VTENNRDIYDFYNIENKSVEYFFPYVVLKIMFFDLQNKKCVVLIVFFFNFKSILINVKLVSKLQVFDFFFMYFCNYLLQIFSMRYYLKMKVDSLFITPNNDPLK